MAKKSKLTKSKSIYTIKNKHSVTNNGVIYENDHFTIIPNDGIFDDEEGDVLKNILWNRIVANMNENNYVEDFALNKSRILSLFDSDDLDDENH